MNTHGSNVCACLTAYPEYTYVTNKWAHVITVANSQAAFYT